MDSPPTGQSRFDRPNRGNEMVSCSSDKTNETKGPEFPKGAYAMTGSHRWISKGCSLDDDRWMFDIPVVAVVGFSVQDF